MRHFLLLFLLIFTHSSMNAQTPLEPFNSVWFNFDDDTNSEFLLINPNDSLNAWTIGWTEKFTGDSISALYTDSSATYANNLNSWFQVRLNDYIAGGPTSIEFDLNGSTEEGDGMYIEVSYDGGINFKNLIFDTIPGPWVGSYTPNPYQNTNLYSLEDTLFNGQPGFSGDRNETIYIQWQGFCVGQPRNYNTYDSVLVRFNFISDSIPSNHQGYAIDDFTMHIALCFNIEEVSNNQFELVQNPIHDFIEMRSLETAFSDYSYEIYNLTGRLIEGNSGLYESVLKIDMKSHSNGSYFLLIRDEENKVISRHKVIKN